MDDVVVLGVGMTRFTKTPERSLADLGQEAVAAALEDAGVDRSDIEAAWAGTLYGGNGLGQRVLKDIGMTGIPIVNVENACASGSTALREAVLAVRAGAADELLAAYSSYGLPLGDAFQLRDDVLGVFGDPAQTGKPAGDDLAEGKRTVLVALALDGAGSDDAARLDASLGRPHTADEVAELRRIIDESGAHAQVEHVIGELADRALAALDAAPIDDTARAVLRTLADAATQRSL